MPTLAAKEFVVVIDAGHGGHDYGAVGDITNEKSINLTVAKDLGNKIKQYNPEIKVVYTRDDDSFISLADRASIANRAKGDLFISIHVNSADKKSKNRRSVCGAEVYTLGLHKSEDNLRVAKRENSVITLEEDYSEAYRGFNPDSPESYIAFELSQSKHMDRSIEFAAIAEHELTTTASRAERGVRQAGFWVLWATGMPSVLVELDFICNPQSERFMNSEKGKAKLSDALRNAFVTYYEYVTGESHPHLFNTSSEDDSEEDEPITERDSDSIPSTNAQPEALEAWKPEPGQIEYRVQIIASDKPLSPGAPDFKGVKNFECYVDGGLHKYTVGHFLSQEDAALTLREMRAKFPTAFIIMMKDGVRQY